MIVKNVCLLLEALSIVICLHHLYGEKFRLDIATVSLLAIDMIMMQAIDYFGISSTVSILIYPIIAVYCGRKFGFKFKTIIQNILLCIAIIGVIQLLVMTICYYIFDVEKFASMTLLIINIIIFLCVTLGLRYIKLNAFLTYVKRKEKIIIIVFGICCIAVALSIVSYKNIKLLELDQALLLFVCIAFIIILAGQLIKYRIKVNEAELELKMHMLYSDSYQKLIDNIRIRQHEFDNHINTIYSQHYKYRTYEELVQVQRNYCELITKENHFNKILSAGNSIIIGFLYVRFVEFDKEGIDVSYKINIKELEVGIPSYKIIELLGDLLNNAVEALSGDKIKNKLYVAVVEEDRFYIEVRNESSYIDYNELSLFFDKDYSKKGENRGLGLYNVKKISEEYEMEISCKNMEIEGINWLSFELWKEKGVEH